MKAEATEKPVVLVLLAVFWAGNDATGPNQSFRALAEALSDEFTFRVVARDRGYGATTGERPIGTWIDCDGISVRYSPIGPTGALDLGPIMRSTRHSILMLNGFYDRDFTLPALLMRRLGRVPRKPTILSPRGEFAPGAMGIKAGRKAAWRFFAHHTGALSDVWLHATSEVERTDIERGYPWARGYPVAPNLRNLIDMPARQRSKEGVTRLVFIGRISRVKNLDYALAVLAQVQSRIRFDVFGPIQDQAFWQECQKAILRLPQNVTVIWRGEIANRAVSQALAAADLFFLPSRSENFGHAIFEALSCGVPVLIADTTPWRGLAERSCGWDLPLSSSAAFARRIDAFAAATDTERAELRSSARRAAEQWVRDSGAADKSREMLRRALAESVDDRAGHAEKRYAS